MAEKIKVPALDEYIANRSDRKISVPALDEYIANRNNNQVVIPDNPLYGENSKKELTAGAKRGMQQIGETLDPILQPSVGRALGMEPSPNYTEGSIAEKQKKYEAEFGDRPIAEIGRTGAQILATAPMVPSAAVNAAFKSAPVAATLGTGAVNRLGGLMATGATAGATYGAATGQGIGENTAAGAIGSPVIAGAGKLGRMVIPVSRKLWANYEVIKAAQDAGVPTSAIRNTLARLEDAGYTTDTAVSELNKIGSKGTLADLDPALTAEVGGLSRLGGKPTSILNNRFGERNDNAASAANDLVNKHLGPKPDIEAEKLAIRNMARKLTAPDYNAAKTTGKTLDITSVVGEIDKELVNAVGSKRKILEEARSYLFDNSGKLKKDVGALHDVRQGIDDMLDRLASPTTSQGRNTLNAANDVRGLIDAKLKSIPEMAAADAVFAKHMDTAKGLQVGYDALTKRITKEEFDKVFDAASPELKNTIRRGLRSAIGDVMERSEQGEGAAARRLFNKKAVNQHILKKAFGGIGSDVIDEIHNEVAQRATENTVLRGSETARNLAIGKRYEKSAGLNLEDLPTALGLDALGAGGSAVAATIAKRGVMNRVINYSTGKIEELAEGTADLLSRQGADRDIGMHVLKTVETINNRLGVKTGAERIIDAARGSKIPTLAIPVGKPFANRASEYVNEKIK